MISSPIARYSGLSRRGSSRHQGRLERVGIGCVGLAIGPGRELGIADGDHRAFERRPACITVARMLARHMCRRPDAGRQPGDPLLLAASLIPRHAGSLAEEDDSTFFP